MIEKTIKFAKNGFFIHKKHIEMIDIFCDTIEMVFKLHGKEIFMKFKRKDFSEEEYIKLKEFYNERILYVRNR